MFAQVPPITRTLIIVNVTIFLLELVLGDAIIVPFALWPFGSDAVPGLPGFHLWQLVSYAFLHGGFAHLFFNMFGLFMFGSEIERLLGRQRYLVYYFTCVVAAAILQLVVVDLMERPPFPSIGASGGVFGLLLAFGMAFPYRRILLLFPPIPMPAWLFVTLYGALELVLGVTGTAQGVAHFAHLGGMAGGYLLIQYWRVQSRRPR